MDSSTVCGIASERDQILVELVEGLSGLNKKLVYNLLMFIHT